MVALLAGPPAKMPRVGEAQAAPLPFGEYPRLPKEVELPKVAMVMYSRLAAFLFITPLVLFEQAATPFVLEFPSKSPKSAELPKEANVKY